MHRPNIVKTDLFYRPTYLLLYFGAYLFSVAVSVPADHDLESSLLAQPPEVGNAEGEDSNAIDAIIIDESDWDHGEAQPQGCRDCFWGFLFLVQFAVVLTISAMGIRNIFDHRYVRLSQSSSTVTCGYTGNCCEWLYC